ncbi:hypothetical protein RHO15_03205 [Utexia brackfieldae]
MQVAQAIAKQRRNTLVIVTADHAYAAQIIPAESHAYGLTQKLITQDGCP